MCAYLLLILISLPYFQSRKGLGVELVGSRGKGKAQRTRGIQALYTRMRGWCLPFRSQAFCTLGWRKAGSRTQRGSANMTRLPELETPNVPLAFNLRKGVDTGYVPDAACSVNASTTYVCMAWNTRIIPPPTNAMPCKVERTVRIKSNSTIEPEKTDDVRSNPMGFRLRRPS